MKARPPQIRIPIDLWTEIESGLDASTPGREPVVFALTSSANVGAKETIVLVRKVIIPPEEAFQRTTSHGAKWTARYNIELLNRCLAEDTGLLIIHRHPEHPVQMSHDDKQSANRIMARFQTAVPYRVHGSVVLGESTVDGLLWMPTSRVPQSQFSVRVLTSPMTNYPEPEGPDRDLFKNQRITLTKSGQQLLRNSRVAIVGISGGGTQVATQLAVAGVGELICVDAQTLEPENRTSTDVPSWLDLWLRRSKLSMMRRKIWWLNPRCSFRAIHGLVPEQRVIDALKRADIIVSCVNNLAARADLVEISGRYCIPLIDLGLTVRTDDHQPDPAPIRAIAGNIFVSMPGGPCPWCTGFITQAKLDKEAGGADRSYLRNMHGSNGRNVLVAPFNGVLANQAACDVLQLMLGFGGEKETAAYKKYDGFSGTLIEWLIRKKPCCPHCSRIVAAGDPIWH